MKFSAALLCGCSALVIFIFADLLVLVGPFDKLEDRVELLIKGEN